MRKSPAVPGFVLSPPGSSPSASNASARARHRGSRRRRRVFGTSASFPASAAAALAWLFSCRPCTAFAAPASHGPRSKSPPRTRPPSDSTARSAPASARPSIKSPTPTPSFGTRRRVTVDAVIDTMKDGGSILQRCPFCPLPNGTFIVTTLSSLFPQRPDATARTHGPRTLGRGQVSGAGRLRTIRQPIGLVSIFSRADHARRRRSR